MWPIRHAADSHSFRVAPSLQAVLQNCLDIGSHGERKYGGSFLETCQSKSTANGYAADITKNMERWQCYRNAFASSSD